MSELDFLKELNDYFDNDQECLIILNDGLILSNCKILKINGKKLQLTCNGDFLDNLDFINRYEMTLKIKDIKYIGRKLSNLRDVEEEDIDDFGDDDNNQTENIYE